LNSQLRTVVQVNILPVPSELKLAHKRIEFFG
jgi:hypothetical protein